MRFSPCLKPPCRPTKMPCGLPSDPRPNHRAGVKASFETVFPSSRTLHPEKITTIKNPWTNLFRKSAAGFFAAASLSALACWNQNRTATEDAQGRSGGPTLQSLGSSEAANATRDAARTQEKLEGR